MSRSELRLDPQDVVAASRRLEPQLVETPLIGDLQLVGFPCAPTLRIKPELVQNAGGIWFRGALHALTRRLGRDKGLVATGRPRELLAVAHACRICRVPLVVVTHADRSDDLGPPVLEERLAAIGCEVDVVSTDRELEARAAAIARDRGFAIAPDRGDVEVEAGLATVGLELAGGLSAEVEVVVVDATIESVVRDGLRAGGRACRLVTVPSDAPAEPALAAALTSGTRLAIDALGARVVAAARALEEPACAVVAE